MGINQLPPQAYTRETLMQAFDWIKTQPQQVQNLASSTDALVSVYMQARRRAGSSVNTHPVSSQSFKQDLKNLAEGLRAFDDESQTAIENPVPPQSSSQNHAAVSAHQLPPLMPNQMPPVQASQSQIPAQHMAPPPPHSPSQMAFHAPPPPAAHSNYAPQVQYPTPQYQAPPMPQQMVTRPMPQPPVGFSDVPSSLLDAKSVEVVRFVQARFNLSSESEALRMLISLGVEKVREIFPK